jgi:hypothetical protein
MPALSTRDTQKFLEAVQAALQSPVADWPEAWDATRPDPRLDPIIALLGVVEFHRHRARRIALYLAPAKPL